MMNWAKQTLANVAGTQEPIYGPSAIKSVAEQAAKVPYTELTRSQLAWSAMESTCVETQSFYLMSDEGHIALAQVIYSNVAGLRTTCQFNSKIFYPDAAKPNLWCSDQLSDVEFSDDKINFYAKDCAVELSEDGSVYKIRSLTNAEAIVNITVTRTAPGFLVGQDGTTYFGTDLENPWGSMKHAFWPRNKVEGTITTKDGPIDFKGKALFIHALQGMKPHHAVSRWNFVDFQGPTYSAIMMEYITPPSYGSTVVSVGGIAKDGELLMAGPFNSAVHTSVVQDTDNDWPEPSEVKYEWTGKTKDGKSVQATMEGPLEERLDKVDVMAEVPGFVKKIVAAAAGTKPYIYQYSPQKTPMWLKLNIDGGEIIEQGRLFAEAVFIS